ncbi:MBOAT family O-acyltransferase [Paenibacillus sp. GXUN7292]|uniref:MBOAT family O-acyltransferase n=1 Tax=Paenibacillus sp. GXUN7292 TaxID=3422499 RepID=UPI003D7EBD56
MLFNSPIFLFFLIIVALLFYLLPKARMYILAIANALFYAYAGFSYFVLFFIVVSSVYFISKGLQTKWRKLALASGLTIVLGNLSFFKYSIFLIGNMERLLGFQFDLSGTILADRSILLPIGISFYSFQLIAYLIDVYRKQLQPSRSLLQFWVFIALFAHSAAGPILRGNDFLPQLEAIKKIRPESNRFKLGVTYICLGLIKKLVIVEYIAPYVNDYYDRASSLSGVEAWLASYLFAFQIYFDFSAYSEMAVGIGLLLGLQLDLNFRTPYLSANANEFWRRWHITLSQWIRDYIFILLGGSRVANWRIYFNLIAAMAISGLWHGAAWTFIIWGVYHGVLSAGHRMYKIIIKKCKLEAIWSSRIYHIFAVFIFFQLTVIGWVFFRANTFSEALLLIKRMLTIQHVELTPELSHLCIVVICLYALHIIEAIAVKYFGAVASFWQRRIPAIVRGAVYAILATVILSYLVHSEGSSFIYFQF